MRAILFTTLFLITAVAQANSNVPSGLNCMKESRKLGLSVIDAYQTCSVKPLVRSCILKQQRENIALVNDRRELASLGKKAIKECQN